MLGRQVEKFLDEFLAARAISLEWVQGLSREDFEAVLAGVKDAVTAQAGSLTTARVQPLVHEIERQLTEWFQLKSTTIPPPSRAIGPSEPQEHEPQMAPDDHIVVSKTLIRGGVRYLPLSEAASLAQAHRTTLLRWIKEETRFEGRPLQSYYFAPSDAYFISEQSIQRLANRFVKWRSGKPAGPAGPVTIGETGDKSGFIGMSEAADIAGVSRRTMWLWVSREKAPTDKPLDVIKCTASDYFYIREKDAYNLKALVPRAGLHRGRRPQLSAQP